MKIEWNPLYPQFSRIPHWRKMNYGLGYECSECGYEAEAEHETCPNCDTKMKAVREPEALPN